MVDKLMDILANKVKSWDGVSFAPVSNVSTIGSIGIGPITLGVSAGASISSLVAARAKARLADEATKSK